MAAVVNINDVLDGHVSLQAADSGPALAPGLAEVPTR
jgi:hypothetical protein